MTGKEMLACLNDRPCNVCKFHTENGCTKWSCVFEKEPDDAENKGEWIPVSERLPKPYEHVLRTVKSIGWNGTSYIDVDLGTICPMNADVAYITAWQPLPEPYKADIRGE